MRDVRSNKKGFCTYIGQIRQAEKSAPPLVIEKGELTTMDMVKGDVLNEFLPQFSQAAKILVFFTSLNLASLSC